MQSSENDRPTAKLVPVSQEQLLQIVLPLIKSGNRHYEKQKQIWARPAITGETIVTVTADGKETTNSAKAGSMVVRNLTEAREEYIVSGDKFATLYEQIGPADGEWLRYRPLGEILALEISTTLIDDLGVNPDFQIMAPWESPQRATLGDMFATPLPNCNEVYRISRKEFAETYRRKTDS